MKLKKYGIYDLVNLSCYKINYKKILKENSKMLVIIFLCSTLLNGLPFISLTINVRLIFSLILATFSVGVDIVTLNMKKLKASKELDELIIELNKAGIKTNKLKLQKSKTICQVNQYYEPRGIVFEEEQIAVFSDSNNQLKALRQIRNEISDYMVYAEEVSKKFCEYPDYTEVITDNEQVKQLLLVIEEKNR